LNHLATVGAEVGNALKYAMSHELILEHQVKKVAILTSFHDDKVFIKFDYNKDIVDEIKKLDRAVRAWNPQHKYWSINKDHFKPLMTALKDIANFKAIKQG